MTSDPASPEFIANENFIAPEINTDENLAKPPASAKQKVIHILSKIISVVLVLHGLNHLREQLYEIFVILPQIPDVSRALNYAPELYNTLIRRTLVISAMSISETTFGITILFKHSSVIKIFHLIAGVGIFLLSYYLLQLTAPLDLEEIEKELLSYLAFYWI